MTEPGPLADEAAKFLGAAQDWLHRVVVDPSTARIATGSAECCWCPLCQLVSTLRGDRPELASQLTEALAPVLGTLPPVLESLTPTLTELRSALAGLLRPAEPAQQSSQASASDAAGSDATGRPARAVQRIDLSGESDLPGGGSLPGDSAGSGD